MNWLEQYYTSDCVVLANGQFPQAEQPLDMLRRASAIVCCDGAVANLLHHGMEPTAVVGDLDSLPAELHQRFTGKLYHFPDQNTNDLTKAVTWCQQQGYNRLTILGATGLREDHTLGNIGLLWRYSQMGVAVTLFTDYGIMLVAQGAVRFTSFEGQQVSLFAATPLTRVTTHNLMYPLEQSLLPELWMGTLNQSLGEWFALDITDGGMVVFQEY